MNPEIIEKILNLVKEGKIEEAENIYKELLAENPNDVNLLTAVGLFYMSLRKLNEAENFFTKACNIEENSNTLASLGITKFNLKKTEEAIEYLEKSLKFGDRIDVYDRLIYSYYEIKDFPKAYEYSEKMYNLYPNDDRAISNKVDTLVKTGKLAEAEEFCVDALKKNDKSSYLWLNLGFLKELLYCDDIQALECFKISLNLGYDWAKYHVAVSLFKQRRFEEAEQIFEEILKERKFSLTDVYTSYGMCLLTQRKFQKGYEQFFKREKSMYKVKNQWQPNEPIPEDIIIFCDQGFGDHIQFARYLPFIKEKCPKMKVVVSSALRELFKKNYPEIEFISGDDRDPEAKVIFITDLAYVLNMDFNNIPSKDTYLDTETKEINNNKLKIGFCWEAGSSGIRTMINRTINIKLFEDFFKIPNTQFYSFQMTDSMNGNENYKDQMINLTNEIKDFNDTASLLKSMDIVVTVDTSLAHISGALGIPTCLLIPMVSDWRWFNNEDTTEWYNSVKIFKQNHPISWEAPFNKLKAYINQKAEEKAKI